MPIAPYLDQETLATAWRNSTFQMTAAGKGTMANGLDITGGDLDLIAGRIYSATDLIFHLTGTNNFFSGLLAGNSSLTGIDNAGAGHNALKALTTGNNNTAFGSLAGTAITSGIFNTLMGSAAGDSITSGARNTAIGGGALGAATTAEDNVSIGYLAMFNALDATDNISIGTQALRFNESGVGNVAVGYRAGAGPSAHSKTGGVFIGNDAGRTETGNNKLYIANSDTSTPLIYGEFDNLLLRVNGILDVAGGEIQDDGVRWIHRSGTTSTFLGENAGTLGNTGTDNVGVGSTALNSITTGTTNTAVGANAGAALTTGSGNTLLGHDAGSAETGSNKLYIANSATTTPLIYGDFSTNALVFNASSIDITDSTITRGGTLLLHSTGTDNFFAGDGSGNASVTGSENAALGSNTGATLTSGSNNVILGAGAAPGITSGSSNVAVGANSLAAMTTASFSIAIGEEAVSDALGGGNIGMGYKALKGVETGGSNVGIGTRAGLLTTNGTRNGCVFIGYRAGEDETGSNLLYIANNLGTPLIYGEFDNEVLELNATVDVLKSAIKFNGALMVHKTGTNNTFLGQSAGNLSLSSNNNVGVGSGALESLTSGGDNVAFGYSAGNALTTGDWNAFVGRTSGVLATTGSFNAALGGGSLAALTTGNRNMAMGYLALWKVEDGVNNVGFGSEALRYCQTDSSNNVAIGDAAGAGTALHNKDGCVFIGYRAGQNEQTSNKLYIANSNTATPLIYGEFDNNLFTINVDDFRIATLSGATNYEQTRIGKYGTSDDVAVTTQSGGTGTTRKLYLAGEELLLGYTVGDGAGETDSTIGYGLRLDSSKDIYPDTNNIWKLGKNGSSFQSIHAARTFLYTYAEPTPAANEAVIWVANGAGTKDGTAYAANDVMLTSNDGTTSVTVQLLDHA